MKPKQIAVVFYIPWIWCAISCWIAIVEGQHRSPRITEHPKDILVKRNEPTTLNCKAEGKPEPSIEWYKDGELQSPSNDGRRIFLPGGDLFFLSVSDGKKESDSGIYWCIARNSIGVVQSRNASLQVGVIRDDFRVLPQSTNVLVGETAIFKCQSPRGTPEPQVLWQKAGHSVDTRLSSSRIQVGDGGNLIIKDAKLTDAGSYMCLAINIAGTRASPEVTLTVHQKPYFKSEPKDVTVLVGDSAIFHCEVDGTPTPTVRWYRQEAQMPNEHERIGNSLRIKETRQEDEGLYFCQVENSVGTIRASALLSVQSKPKFIVRPKHIRIDPGQHAKFECSVIGNPIPTTYWRKAGSQQLLWTGMRYMETGHLFVTPEGTLHIRDVRNNDNGVYVCSSTNTAGSIEIAVRLELSSSSSSLPELEQPFPPVIKLGPTNQTLPIKSMVSFPCDVSSEEPHISIQWFKDGMDMAREVSESRITISENGTLHINDLRASDSGLYTCVASGRQSGETSRTGHLLVESPTNPNIAFRRTDLALLPPAPSAPTSNETTSTTITLSWTWSWSTKLRTPALLGYTLESYSPDLEASSWTTVGRRIYSGGAKSGEVLHTVDGLKPNTKYVFLVRAETQEGFSPASNMSKIIKTRPAFRDSAEREEEEEFDEEELRNQLSSSDIELISCDPASSTSIRISWKVSKSVIKFIDGYYVRYREISSGGRDGPSTKTFHSSNLVATVSPEAAGEQEKGFNILTVAAQKTDAYSHTIPNLKKFTQYEVFVAPFYTKMYKSVEGLVSNSKMVITSEDRPSAPPQSLLSRLLSTSTATVRWSPPPDDEHNGVLIGYRVEVRGNESYAEMSFGSNITSIVLSNLTVGRSYHVRVSAFTSVGPGPWSPQLTVSMDPESVDLNPRLNSNPMEGPSEILKEVWFIVLMGLLLFIFLLLLVIILYTKRKQHGKKDHITSAPLPSHSESQFLNGKQTLWIDQRWRPCDKDSNRSEIKLLSNHTNGDLSAETADYAEVDPHSLTTFYSSNSNSSNSNHKVQFLQQQQQDDLTPYATTTLIQRRPNYNPLPTSDVMTKNHVDNYREPDQYNSGRGKLPSGSNNYSKFKPRSTHPSPAPSPSSVPLKMVPMSTRMGSCYPSPGPNHRSHQFNNTFLPSEQQLLLQQHPYNSARMPSSITTTNHANENLYHIGEIFTPNKSSSSSSSINNRFSEAIYQSGDPENSNFLPQMQQQSSSLCPLIDRENQSSLPSLASADSTSFNLYAECNDDDIIIPSATTSMMIGSNGAQASNNYMLGSNSGGIRPIKNSRSTSPAYSSDSFNSAKSANKRLYKGGHNYGGGSSNNKKKFDSSCKSLERRHLTPLLPPGRTGDDHRPNSFQPNGFSKLPRLQKAMMTAQQQPSYDFDHDFPNWQHDSNDAFNFANSLKESNA